MLTLQIKQGRGGRHRWFAVNEAGTIHYSSFPRSFASDQEAWEHAEWACGASVTMRYDLFEQHAEGRDFTN